MQNLNFLKIVQNCIVNSTRNRKKLEFNEYYMNGKLPICIENEKIEKPRKSLVGEIDTEKGDFFGNADW